MYSTKEILEIRHKEYLERRMELDTYRRLNQTTAFRMLDVIGLIGLGYYLAFNGAIYSPQLFFAGSLIYSVIGNFLGGLSSNLETRKLTIEYDIQRKCDEASNEETQYAIEEVLIPVLAKKIKITNNWMSTCNYTQIILIVAGFISLYIRS